MERNLPRCMKAVCGLAFGAILLGGCNGPTTDEATLLLEENRELRDQLNQRTAAIETTQAEIRDREVTIAELERSLADARSAPPMEAYPTPVYNTPAPGPFGGIEGVTSTASAGEVTASLESDLLFDAGRATLKSGAKRSLEAVVRIINESYAGRTIRVAGHTDSDPIRKSGHKSNYHLGFERAYAVRSFLVEKGVPASQVYIASHGPNRARPSKKESRRVDVAVVLNDS